MHVSIFHSPDIPSGIASAPEAALPSAPASEAPKVIVKAPKKAPKEPKKPKVRVLSEKKNGIVRPGDGTKTGRVWAICDEIAQSTQAPPKRANVIDRAVKEDLGAGTASTQFGRWCKYWGVVNDRSKPSVPAPEGATEAAPNAGKRGPKAKKSGKKNLTAAEGNAALGDVQVESGEPPIIAAPGEESQEDVAAFVESHEAEK